MINQTIFVTGGTGFVGSYLLRYLVAQKKGTIRALKRKNSPMDLVESIRDQVEWIEGDLLNPGLLEAAISDCQYVFHCAAMVSFDSRLTKTMQRVNEEGTENVVNAAQLHRVKKLVHISSIAALGKARGNNLIDEGTNWKADKNHSAYAISKNAAEMHVWRAMAEGLNGAILNPSVILGSGFWDTTSCRIFKVYSKGFPFYSVGSNGFVDVRDVAKMAILLIDSPVNQERFVVNGENLSFRELFNTISQYAGKPLPYLKLSALFTGLGWRADWLKSRVTGIPPIITRESVMHASEKNFYDNSKSIERFSYEYIPIRETIAQTVDQYLESAQKGLKSMVLPLR